MQRGCESPAVCSIASVSACSSVSDGCKYSRRAVYKFRPKFSNSSHANSASSSVDSAWRSLDSKTWKSIDGAEIHLKGTRIDKLSESEKQILQGIALQRLSCLIPHVLCLKSKEHTFLLRQKRQKLLKGRGAQHVGERSPRGSASSSEDERRLFGVPLHAAVENERRIEREMRCRSLDEYDGKDACSVPARRWLLNKKTASVQSEPEILRIADDENALHSKKEGAASSSSACPSPEGSFCRCAFHNGHSLNVPRLVIDCTDFLRKHGLDTVGLFRITGSAKRCRNLRSVLERASAPNLNLLDSSSPHDIATLLKEYLRDLPQPLLPSEHYSSFIAASKLGLEQRIEVLRLLVALMQTANCDTLFMLLKLLRDVSDHCNDKVDSQGCTLYRGNKMDTRNLATIFAPSLLRPPQTTLCETLVENDAHITVVETMIEFVDAIFTVPKEIRDRIFRKLREIDPDGLDRILQQLARCDQQTDSTQPSSPAIFAAMAEEESFDASCFDSSLGDENPSSAHSSVQGDPEGIIPSSRSRSWPFSLTRWPRLPKVIPCCKHTTVSQAEMLSSNSSVTARRRLQQVVRALGNVKLRSKTVHRDMV